MVTQKMDLKTLEEYWNRKLTDQEIKGLKNILETLNVVFKGHDEYTISGKSDNNIRFGSKMNKIYKRVFLLAPEKKERVKDYTQQHLDKDPIIFANASENQGIYTAFKNKINKHKLDRVFVITEASTKEGQDKFKNRLLILQEIPALNEAMQGNGERIIKIDALNTKSKSKSKPKPTSNTAPPTDNDYISYQKVRANQNKFKNNILNIYNSKCAVTGCVIKKILDGAHIIPYSVEPNNERWNGLLLRSDIHRLYDCGLLKIDESGIISFSGELQKDPFYSSLKLELNGKKIAMPDLNEADMKEFKMALKSTFKEQTRTGKDLG